MENLTMIVRKVKVHLEESKVIKCQPPADAEMTSSGIPASQDDIRMCAYYIYQKRGSAPGCDTQDWAQAERLIGQR